LLAIGTITSGAVLSASTCSGLSSFVVASEAVCS
jgi:hypothetical protein